MRGDATIADCSRVLICGTHSQYVSRHYTRAGLCACFVLSVLSLSLSHTLSQTCSWGLLFDRSPRAACAMASFCQDCCAAIYIRFIVRKGNTKKKRAEAMKGQIEVFKGLSLCGNQGYVILVEPRWWITEHFDTPPPPDARVLDPAKLQCQIPYIFKMCIT